MSVQKILDERGSRYGEFAEHAKIAQDLMDIMRNTKKWNQLDPDMKQALQVIMDKVARILNGDPFYDDNWVDISGYATLIVQRLAKILDSKDELYA